LEQCIPNISPDSLRCSATEVSAIGLAPCGSLKKAGWVLGRKKNAGEKVSETSSPAFELLVLSRLSSRLHDGLLLNNDGTTRDRRP